jgi:hypothetical protein
MRSSNPQAAWSSFRELAAKQSSHLGADGLGFAGNLWWYFSTAMPIALTWPQMALALVGIAGVWRSGIRPPCSRSSI